MLPEHGECILLPGMVVVGGGWGGGMKKRKSVPIVQECRDSFQSLSV